MAVDYTPGGRWVRLMGGHGPAIAPIGRWHLAMKPPLPHHDRPGRVVLMCGRELRPRAIEGGEVISIVDLPYANLCEPCRRHWRQRPFPAGSDRTGDELRQPDGPEEPIGDGPFWVRAWAVR